jgi:hypothetical protein
MTPLKRKNSKTQSLELEEGSTKKQLISPTESQEMENLPGSQSPRYVPDTSTSSMTDSSEKPAMDSEMPEPDDSSYVSDCSSQPEDSDRWVVDSYRWARVESSKLWCGMQWFTYETVDDVEAQIAEYNRFLGKSHYTLRSAIEEDGRHVIVIKFD